MEENSLTKLTEKGKRNPLKTTVKAGGAKKNNLITCTRATTMKGLIINRKKRQTEVEAPKTKKEA